MQICIECCYIRAAVTGWLPSLMLLHWPAQGGGLALFLPSCKGVHVTFCLHVCVVHKWLLLMHKFTSVAW